MNLPDNPHLLNFEDAEKFLHQVRDYEHQLSMRIANFRYPKEAKLHLEKLYDLTFDKRDALYEWFMKHGAAEDFSFCESWYIGHKSTHTKVFSSEWSDDWHGIDYHFINYDNDFPDAWWRLKIAPPSGEKCWYRSGSERHVFDLADYLKPLTESELLRKFSSVDGEDERFMVELVKYIHCKSFVEFCNQGEYSTFFEDGDEC